jgi:hypothetical protein
MPSLEKFGIELIIDGHKTEKSEYQDANGICPLKRIFFYFTMKVLLTAGKPPIGRVMCGHLNITWKGQ